MKDNDVPLKFIIKNFYYYYYIIKHITILN